MKRILGLLVVSAFVLIVAGCAFDKTYYYQFGGAASGFCEEVVTNNSTIESDLSLIGYSLGTCASAGFSGGYCSYSYGSGTTTYTINEYWGTSLQSVYGTSSYCSTTLIEPRIESGQTIAKCA